MRHGENHVRLQGLDKHAFILLTGRGNLQTNAEEMFPFEKFSMKGTKAWASFTIIITVSDSKYQ